MAFENKDYTDYTEVDSSAEITVASDSLTFGTLAIDEDAYVTFDYGAGYFGDFVLRVPVTLTAATFDGGNAGQMSPFLMTATAIHTMTPFWAGSDGFMLQMYRSGASYYYTLYEKETGDDNEDTWTTGLTPAWTHYIEIERSGTTLTAKFYSDSSYETLLKTLTVTTLATTLRYHTPLAALDQVAADADTITGVIGEVSIDTTSPVHTRTFVALAKDVSWTAHTPTT